MKFLAFENLTAVFSRFFVTIRSIKLIIDRIIHGYNHLWMVIVFNRSNLERLSALGTAFNAQTINQSSNNTEGTIISNLTMKSKKLETLCYKLLHQRNQCRPYR